MNYNDIVKYNNAPIVTPDEYDFSCGNHTDEVTTLLDNALDLVLPKRTKMVRRDLPDSDIIKSLIELKAVSVAVDDESFSYLEKEAPWLRLVQQPERPHDHPVSHCLTEINEAYVVSGFGKRKFVDVFGNPRRHIRAGRKCVSYTTKATAKDYLRAFDEIPGQKTFTSFRAMARENMDVRDYLMTHSLYYVDSDELGQLLHTGNNKKRVHAIVHRHPDTAGKLNNGEYAYECRGESVTQWSVKTDEGYTHRNVEPFFHQDSVQTSYGPIAWTRNKLAGDTYLLEFVAAPGLSKAPRALPTLKSLKEKGAVTISGNDTYKVRQFWNTTWVEYQSTEGPIVLEDVELFDILRRYVAGRDRNASELKNLTLLARRLVDKRDIFAKHSAVHDIPAEMLMTYVNAAYHADVEAEINTMLSFRARHRAALDMHAKLMAAPDAYDDSWATKIAAVNNATSKAASAFTKPIQKMVESIAPVAMDSAVSAALAVPLYVHDGQVKHRTGIAQDLTGRAVTVLGGLARHALSKTVDDTTFNSAPHAAVLRTLAGVSRPTLRSKR